MVDGNRYPNRLRIIDSVAYIPEIVDSLSEQLCASSKPLPCCGTTPETVSIDPGLYKYYQPTCTNGTHDVAVILDDEDGNCKLYISNSSATPGPLTSQYLDDSTALSKRIRLPASTTAVSCKGEK